MHYRLNHWFLDRRTSTCKCSFNVFTLLCLVNALVN